MATVCQNIIYHRLTDNKWQELMKDNPMIMPYCQAVGLEVSFIVSDRRILRPNEIHRAVMKQKNGRMQTGDHNVLIVAWVTKNRCVIGGVSRQIFELTAAFDSEFDCVRGFVSLRITAWSAGVNGIQIKEWSASVG